jgi:pimeloyl-ACP methyl ester carboxylesterase
MRFFIAALALLPASFLLGDDGERLVAIDHYVRVRSAVPMMAGQDAEIYVREVVQARTVLRGGPAADRVALFVHGAGTPAEVAFDVPYQDYSWMAYLAHAGFDVFSMDMTGYGRSSRPAPMNDPCNLAAEQQKAFIPALISEPCKPAYSRNLTTIASDWNDLDAVVNHIRGLRHVERLSFIAWSLGGPRAGGYASQHPDKVLKLVLLAPAYNRDGATAAPERLPADGIAFNTQSHEEFIANWDRQIGCPDQYDKTAAEAVWKKMLESDPVGATWGTGMRRAPQVTTWGWNQAAASKLQAPTLMVAGVHDKQVRPERVKELYADLGARQKVVVDLGCSSHNALWERNHLLLFKASLEWLVRNAVNGSSSGEIKVGY